MNVKTFTLLCALSTSAFSLTAFSAEGDFCTNPLQKVCKDTLAERSQRESYVSSLKAEISAEAKVAAAPRIAEMERKVPRFRIIRRLLQRMKIRNQEIMRSAKKRVGDIETIVTSAENIEILKNSMKQAIDESQFDASTKANFKSIMDSIIIGNFADFLERTNLEDDVIAQLTMNACGPDGLVSNAFATTIKNERYVLMCPGFLISLSQAVTKKEKFESILFAISHEMGHHIDNSKVGNDLYKPYLTCLAGNYSGEFNKTEADKKFCKKNSERPDLCNLKVTVSHGGELIADAWGIKVLNIHARKESFSSVETNGFLVNNWARLCDGGDEGIHPTTDFRIGTLVRKDPNMSEYLACDNSELKNKPACTLEGAVEL